MSADSRRIGRIRGYIDAGMPIDTCDVDWLIAEVERLTADRDRYKAWHDEVMARPIRAYDDNNQRLIVRPQPLKGKAMDTVMQYLRDGLADAEQQDKAANEISTLRARVAELEPMAECAAIMAICGYFSRMRGPDFYAYQFPTCVRFSADTYNGSRPLQAIPLYAGSAPVPAVQEEHATLRARVAELEREVEAKRQDHEAACCIIADMHRAAVGEVTGPRRGVVEDVEDIHRMAECAAIMAVCGYFSRMRGPDAWELRAGNKRIFWINNPSSILPSVIPLYAGPAPVPAIITKMSFCASCGRPMAANRAECPDCQAPAQAEAKVADDVVRDAERWRLVRERGAYWGGPYAAWLVRLPYAETFEQAVDAMLAAKAKGIEK